MTATIRVTPELVTPAQRIQILVTDVLADKNPSAIDSITIEVVTDADDHTAKTEINLVLALPKNKIAKLSQE